MRSSYVSNTHAGTHIRWLVGWWGVGSILEAMDSAALMNLRSFCLSIVILDASSVKMKKMKRKKPHTVTVGEVPLGR